MYQYLARRFLGFLLVLVGAATLVFVLMRALPGDPAAVLTAQSGGSADDIAHLRVGYALDRPLWQQYLSFLSRLARGDLGRSLFTRQRVSQIVLQQAPATVALALAAMAVALSVGLPVGVMAAVGNRWLTRVCTVLSVLGVSMPITLSGLLMILLFSLTLRLLPATGQGTPAHLIMPAAVMGLASASSISRVVQTQLQHTMQQDYINAARARGLSERAIITRHALRNAMIPSLTVIGLQFGFMLGGAVATESVFARQGLGRTLVEAILYRDYPVVEGVVLVCAGLYTAINLIVDLAYIYLDPRIYHE